MPNAKQELAKSAAAAVAAQNAADFAALAAWNARMAAGTTEADAEAGFAADLETNRAAYERAMRAAESAFIAAVDPFTVPA